MTEDEEGKDEAVIYKIEIPANRYTIKYNVILGKTLRDTVFDVATAEVSNGTGFYSLVTNFTHLVASLAAMIFLLYYYYYLIFYSSNAYNECPIADYMYTSCFNSCSL